MSDETNDLYKFDGFRLDMDRHLLLRGSKVVALTPKAFGTLVALMARRERSIYQDKLLRDALGGANVEEATAAKSSRPRRESSGIRPGRPHSSLGSPGSASKRPPSHSRPRCADPVAATV